MLNAAKSECSSVESLAEQTHAARHMLVNAQGVGSTCAKDAVPHRRSEQAEMRSPNASKCTPKGAGSRRRDSVGSLQRIERVCEKGAKESRAEAHLERGRELMVLSRRFPADTGRRQWFTVTDFKGSHVSISYEISVEQTGGG